MKASGIKEERETIIVFSEDDRLASLWTASDAIYRQMKKRGWIPSQDDERHALFEFPKTRLKLPKMPSTTRGFAGRSKVNNAKTTS